MFKKALLASAAVMAAGVASAEVTGNFAITSDYIFRGVSSGQAVQGGLDWSHDSGAYAGVWLSNAAIDDDTENEDEVNYYVGYGLGLNDGLSLDLGYIRYTSDESTDGDINEVYVGVAGEAWSATLYYGDEERADSTEEDEFYYLDLGYDVACGETTSVSLHAGYLSDEADDNDAIDLSVTYNVGDFSMGLSYLDHDDDGADDDEDVLMVVGWGTEFDVK